MGTIINIELCEEAGETRYTFIPLFSLDNPKPLSSLKLVSTKKPLSNNYIRPYAIVLLPEGIRAWEEEKGIACINRVKHDGTETFRYNRMALEQTLSDFWQWAFSDLLNNTLRGVLAEYIVALALGIHHDHQAEWNAYDLDYRGLKIEVKSSAYLQSWYQKKYSKIIFRIPKTRSQEPYSLKLTDVAERHSDLYVFCLLKHKIQATLNPLDLNQWQFFLIGTTDLDKQLGDAKTISLTRLKKLNVISCDYNKLEEKIALLSQKIMR